MMLIMIWDLEGRAPTDEEWSAYVHRFDSDSFMDWNYAAADAGLLHCDEEEGFESAVPGKAYWQVFLEEVEGGRGPLTRAQVALGSMRMTDEDAETVAVLNALRAAGAPIAGSHEIGWWSIDPARNLPEVLHDWMKQYRNPN